MILYNHNSFTEIKNFCWSWPLINMTSMRYYTTKIVLKLKLLNISQLTFNMADNMGMVATAPEELKRTQLLAMRSEYSCMLSLVTLFCDGTKKLNITAFSAYKFSKVFSSLNQCLQLHATALRLSASGRHNTDKPLDPVGVVMASAPTPHTTPLKQFPHLWLITI